MTRNPDVLERLAPLSGAPSRGFEDLLRLRAKRQLARKIGTIAVVTALTATLLGVGLGTIGDRTKRPANPPHESHPGTFTGMVIRYTGDLTRDRVGNLVAEDPRTGEAITLVDHKVPGVGHHTIGFAAASADGRWAAFDAPFCQDGITDSNGTAGLWVTNGVDEPRQLTTPCSEDGSDAADLWEWSPTGSRLATVAGNDNERGNQLILIDPATGDRTDLGQTAGGVTSLAWSPDGTQIAYATVPTGSGDETSDGSVYVVSVSSGTHALIAESLGGEVPGGEEGAGIGWSPDGTRIAVVADAGTPTLYVMKADGSHRQPLAEGVFIAHALGSPDIAWSPDGTRIAYATSSGAHGKGVQIWSASADGSTPVLVFDPTADNAFHEAGGPIWSPDGTQIAFRYDTNPDQRSYLIANADGTGAIREIDELQYRRWRGGWYFCECYG
jgi:WD40 repeat protein